MRLQGDLVPGWLRRFVVSTRQVADVVQQMATHVHLNAARVQQQQQQQRATEHDDDAARCSVLDAMFAAAASPTTADRMCSTGLTHAHLTSLPLEFLSAGSETSSATLLWILRFMVLHPDVQVMHCVQLVYQRVFICLSLRLSSAPKFVFSVLVGSNPATIFDPC